MLCSACMLDAAHFPLPREAGVLAGMQPWLHLPRLQQLPEARMSDSSTPDEAVVA